MYGGAISMVCNIVRTGIRVTNRDQGYSPAKPKTECEAFSIGLSSKLSARSMVGTCRVRLMWWLWWWQARSKRLMRGGVFPCQTKN
jgi:hypothetical protein